MKENESISQISFKQTRVKIVHMMQNIPLEFIGPRLGELVT